MDTWTNETKPTDQPMYLKRSMHVYNMRRLSSLNLVRQAYRRSIATKQQAQEVIWVQMLLQLIIQIGMTFQGTSEVACNTTPA